MEQCPSALLLSQELKDAENCVAGGGGEQCPSALLLIVCGGWGGGGGGGGMPSIKDGG